MIFVFINVHPLEFVCQWDCLFYLFQTIPAHGSSCIAVAFTPPVSSDPEMDWMGQALGYLSLDQQVLARVFVVNKNKKLAPERSFVLFS